MFTYLKMIPLKGLLSKNNNPCSKLYRSCKKPSQILKVYNGETSNQIETKCSCPSEV